MMARVIIWLNLGGSSLRELSSDYMYILREYLEMSNLLTEVEKGLSYSQELLPSLLLLANCDTV